MLCAGAFVVREPSMRTILVIGIGTGSPEQMTGEAIAALGRADLVIVPDKGEEKAELRAVRDTIFKRHARPDCRHVVLEMPLRDAADPDYRGGVDAWHEAIARGYADLFSRNLGEGRTAALLVWGDPALYDSTLRILERVRRLGPDFAVEVVPGISSVQVLAARHGIPLNRIGESVLITTGRKLRQGWPAGADSVVVMLDGECSFQALAAGDFEIWWGAYLGMPAESLFAGPLDTVGPQIVAAREKARGEHGWIMDCYLLRRRSA